MPISKHVFKPDKVAPTPDRIASLNLPPGFKVTALATGLKNARILTVSPTGAIYVTVAQQRQDWRGKVQAATAAGCGAQRILKSVFRDRLA